MQKSKLPALFIGRFQPFHNGHLDALQQIMAYEESVIIGIGSAEDDYTFENPFSAGERFQMINESLPKVMKKKVIGIIPVRNINQYGLWVNHVERLLPSFGTIYTGSPIVARLFKDHGKHTVKKIIMRVDVSGMKIREAMVENKKWENMVPSEVSRIIKKMNGVERLKEINT